jgi:hypothetical protein
MGNSYPALKTKAEKLAYRAGVEECAQGIEQQLCAALGREWVSYGPSPAALIEELEARAKRPA